jgi:hypothetical protein
MDESIEAIPSGEQGIEDKEIPDEGVDEEQPKTTPRKRSLQKEKTVTSTERPSRERKSIERFSSMVVKDKGQKLYLPKVSRKTNFLVLLEGFHE